MPIADFVMFIFLDNTRIGHNRINIYLILCDGAIPLPHSVVIYTVTSLMVELEKRCCVCNLLVAGYN